MREIENMSLTGKIYKQIDLVTFLELWELVH